MKSALLLSGGMDSIALAWWKRPDYAITIDYGQKAALAEFEASRSVCARLEIELITLAVPCADLGSGDMAGKTVSLYGQKSDWWPYRNQLLVTLASMRLIDLGVNQLMIASVATDNSHVDGTGQFIETLDALVSLQEGGLRITAPAINLSTEELIRKSRIPSHILAWAHSCHKANVACGNCRGCNKYFSVYEELASTGGF